MTESETEQLTQIAEAHYAEFRALVEQHGLLSVAVDPGIDAPAVFMQRLRHAGFSLVETPAAEPGGKTITAWGPSGDLITITITIDGRAL